MTQAPEDYPAFRKIIESSAGTLCWGNGDPIVDRIDVVDDFQALLDHNASLHAVIGELVEAAKAVIQESTAQKNNHDMKEAIFNLIEALSRANQSNSKST